MERKSGRIERIPPGRRGDGPVVYRVTANGRVGGLSGLLAALVLFSALGAIVVLGFLTLAVAFWIALGVAVLGVASALLRALFGQPRPR